MIPDPKHTSSMGVPLPLPPWQGAVMETRIEETDAEDETTGAVLSPQDLRSEVQRAAHGGHLALDRLATRAARDYPLEDERHAAAVAEVEAATVELVEQRRLLGLRAVKGLRR
jgi:hypothetical protein